jgi:hypothetical protein
MSLMVAALQPFLSFTTANYSPFALGYVSAHVETHFKSGAFSCMQEVTLK